MLLAKAALMGIVEGLTEFLPISSTGHLILAGALMDLHGDKFKVFEIAIQTGAIFAVILIYRQRLVETLGGLGSDLKARRFATNVAIAFVADTEGEAVRMLAAEAWDVVILDLQLRSGTGLGVLKAMHDWRNDAPRTAIVFTNYGFPQYRDRALALGAQHFFDKAKDLEALKGLLLQLAANR